MINPKELRIGNLVNSAGMVMVVSRIYEDRIFYKEYDPRTLMRHPSDIGANPIPLTHELLLKIGADYDDHRPFDEFYDFESYYFECSKLTNVAIHYSHNNKKFYYPKYEIAPVEYLHQLQNLFFALTGEELEIKL